MKTTAKKNPRLTTAASRALSLRTILVPTDFSPPSHKALKYARALATQFRAALHLVNVFDVQFEAPSLAPLYATDEQIEERLGRRLRTIAGEFAEPIRKGRCLARVGRAFDEICQVARRLHADLIVTVTHGYTGLKRALIGSTAECIVRHAPCPVLVVREKEREFLRGNGKTLPVRRSLRIRHILVPTDFSEHSRIALQYAVTFAEHFGARLTLLNVIYPQYFATSGDYMALDYPNLLEETRRTARRDFNEFVRNTAFQGAPFQTHIEDGHPGQHFLQNSGRKLAPLVPRFDNGAG